MGAIALLVTTAFTAGASSAVALAAGCTTVYFVRQVSAGTAMVLLVREVLQRLALRRSHHHCCLSPLLLFFVPGGVLVHCLYGVALRLQMLLR